MRTTGGILANARALGAAAGTALLLVGCGARPAPELPRDRSLVVALESAPLQLDPRVGTDQASSRLYDLLCDGLATKTPTGDFVPNLASWETLDEGLRVRFHLRDDVRFHDGRPLTAADVAWTFSSILDGQVATSKRGAFSQLTRVEAVGERDVDFHLAEPYGALVTNLTSYLGIVPAGVLPEAFALAPVCTGPFRFVSRTSDRVVLAANDDYFLGRPRLDRIELREVPDSTVRALELRKGSVQLAVNALPPDVVPIFAADPGFEVATRVGANYVYVGLNFRDPLLARREVRRALLLALDRERLVASLWRGLGEVTETIVPPGHWARHDALPRSPHDPEAAMRMLDAANLPDPDGPAGPAVRFRLTFKTSTDETALLQAQILQAMWARIGVEVELRSYEFATFYEDIRRGNFQMFSLTWTGVADPDIYSLILHSAKAPPAGANRGRYANPEFDRLIEAGRRLSDPGERRPFYLRAQEIVADDLPYLSLFVKTNVAIFPKGLEGYEHYPSGELYGLRQVHWRGDP